MTHFAPILLFLALSLSWSRFVVIFRPTIDAGAARSPLTMVASAVSISSLALAVADHGPVVGLVLILSAVLVAHILPERITLSAIIASCVSLCTYLRLIEMLG